MFYNEHDLREATGLIKKVSLIDGKPYQFDYNNKEFSGIYDNNSKSFIFINGNALEEFTDNIQPLTVEVK